MKLRTNHGYLFEKFAKDMIEGGKSDGKNPKSSTEDKKMGKKVEMEHTNNPEVAKEIARDHHDEDPNYYKKLDLMENPPKLNKSQRILANFLKKNPNPKDEEEIHALADKNKINKHKMEEGAYALLAEYNNTFNDKK